MHRLIRFCFLISLCFVFLSSCGGSSKNLSIAIDPNWYPEDFRTQGNNVNGFVDELLLEISKYSGYEFQRIGSSWDNLFDGLRQHRYEAVLTSLPPYNFNTAKYDFSCNFLDIGPVLVVPMNEQPQELKDMSNKVVGILSLDQELIIMQKNPNVLIRNYNLASDALSALMNHEVEGVVLDRLTAVNFLRGVYRGKLHIVGDPLSEAGLHLMIMKNANPKVIKVFNKSIQHLAKKKKLQMLLEKWNLGIAE